MPDARQSFDDSARHNNFVASITGVLDHIRKTGTGNALRVSCGWPISTAGQVQGLITISRSQPFRLRVQFGAEFCQFKKKL